ncbi:MAG TPA: TonB-dependent receptor [Candidatus Acidoferrales bacterium]|nr:TonB-dependent receptor [Candidatus Acidoferrales bacterium]
MRTFPRRARRFVIFALFAFLIPDVAAAAASVPTVEGTVTSSDGRPIAGARIALRSGNAVATATSDARGAFKITVARPGVFTVTAGAAGYSSLSRRVVEITPGANTLTLELARETTSSLAVIGEVRTSSGASISTTTGSAKTVNAQSAAAQGTTEVSSMLWSQMAMTPVIPFGGGSNATTSFAIRGPDPSETLVDIDGHTVNNGNTGDFDLSLLDPADLSSIQVIYGIAPSSLIGPNTIGGAVNIVTLQPTGTPQALVRGFLGSYGSTGQTVQATGTSGRFGYVASLHRATSLGSVNETVVNSGGDAESVGSSFFGETLLSKLRYQIGSYGYLQVSVRNQAVDKDMSALLTNYTPPGCNCAGDDAGGDDGSGYQTFQGTSLASHQANYGFDAVIPLGPSTGNPPATVVQFSHLTSYAQQSVTGPGAETDPYLYNQRDLVGDDWLQIDRHFAKGDLSLKYDLSTESLITYFVPGTVHGDLVSKTPFASPTAGPLTPYPVTLDQTQRSLVVRYDGNPSSYFHYSLAAYDSDYSIFGRAFLPRVGASWTPTARTAVRFSLGSTFQIPQLTSMFVPPALPPPVGGVISIGNPNLKPEFATEYDMGIEQIFGREGSALHLSADVYQTNNRTTIAVPVAPVPPPDCKKKNDCPILMPVNAGNAVYRGIDLQAEQQLGPHYRLRAGWDVDSSFLSTVPPSVQDGTLVAGEQTLGQPLHKAYIGFDRDVGKGWVYGAVVNWEGSYNELNRSPYATLDAHVAFRTPKFELGAYGTNLTNAYANAFTVNGAGVPYGSLPGTRAILTPAYVIPGTKVIFVGTLRM